MCTIESPFASSRGQLGFFADPSFALGSEARSANMPRIRSIKPSFFQHDRLSTLSSDAHLLAAGLLCYADDEGYFLANPKLIQAAIFPLRELSMSLPELLRSLHGIGYIEILQGSDGREYGKVVKFLDHQKVSHSVPSKIKPLCEASVKPPEVSVRPHGGLRPELNRIELKGIEGEGNGVPLSFEDVTPIEAARMFLVHEDVCIPATEWELKDTRAGIEAIQTQEKLTPKGALDWLLDRAKKAKAAGKTVGPGWVRKCGYNGTGKKQVPMVDAYELKRKQMEAD